MNDLNRNIVPGAITAVPATPATRPLVTRMADRYGIEPGKLMETLKATCFKGAATNEQMAALLIVAEQYGLNPFTKEIYAFPDKSGGITPVVGVDGWVRITNNHPHFRGMTFREGPTNQEDIPKYFECSIIRNDREVPTTIEEHYNECYRDTAAWNDSPRRMLRHRSMVQCARIAFGFAGIYLEDEAERIVSNIEARADRDGRALKAGKPATRAPRARVSEVVSADQITVLNDALKEHARPMEEFLSKHCIAHIADLPAKLFDGALAWIETDQS